MSIDISAGHVGPGDVLDVVADPNSTYTYLFSYTLLDEGVVRYTSNRAGATVIAVSAGSSFGNYLVQVTADASLAVNATGAGSAAYGYSSGSTAAAIENAGSWTVTGAATAIGAIQWDGLHFTNTGTFSVTGDNAQGVFAEYDGPFDNRSAFTVQGVTSAIGLRLGVPFGSSTIHNSGTMTVSASSGSSTGILIGSGGGSLAPTAIENTGTITAATAIMGGTVLVDNSGQINGDIFAGAQSSIHNTGTIHGAVHLDGAALYNGVGGVLTGGVYLGSGTETVLLGDHGEAVHGGAGVAIVLGGAGADVITGGSGNDLIDGGAGTADDVLDGGGGTNTVSYAAASSGVTVSLALQEAAQDTIGAGHDTLSHFQSIIGSAFSDLLTGDSNDNVMDGNAGDDGLDGGGGTNTVSYASSTSGVKVSLALQGQAQDTVGAGHDTLANFQNLIGSAFDDVLTGDVHDNVIEGAAGNDVLDGGGGTNTVSYAASTAGVTVSLALTQSQDTGGAGHDTLANFQNLIGSTFNDTLEGSSGDNLIDGSGGTNTISYAHADSGVTVSLALQGGAQDTVGAGHDTLTHFQNLTGSAFADILTGDAGANVINGGGGDDLINGGGGADKIDGGTGVNTVTFAGGAGVKVDLALGQAVIGGIVTAILKNIQNVVGSSSNDVLTGNGDNNVLAGGTGADTFVIGKAGGADTIADFSHAEGDRIDLSSLYRFFSFAEIQAAMTQAGADTVIDLGAGASLTLQNVQASDLTSNDFVLAPITVQNGEPVIIDATANLSVSAAGGQTYLTPIVRMLDDATVVNDGVLSISGGYIVQGFVVSGGYRSSFTNNGQINATLGLGTLVQAAAVDNTGTITANFIQPLSGVVLAGAVTTNSGHINLTNGTLVGGSGDVSFQNLASGVVTITDGVGFNAYNGGVFDNAGTFTVSSGTAVYIGRAEIGSDGSPYSRVSNSGTITVTDGVGFNIFALSAPSLPAGEYNVINSGTLTAATAISFHGNMIIAAIDNSGTINGDVTAGSGTLRLHNTGTINGDVSLGVNGYYSNNVDVDSHLGVLHGTLTLATGSATVVLGAEDNTVAVTGVRVTDVIDGGGGVNTLSYAAAASGVTVSLVLQGRSQATGLGTATLAHFQNLIGSGFNDVLTDNEQNNVLTGGAGADVFVLRAGGADTITDFSSAQGDKIDLSVVFPFLSFNDVLLAATQSGADTVITVSTGSLTLKNVQLSSLTARDFVLSASLPIVIGSGAPVTVPAGTTFDYGGTSPLVSFQFSGSATLINNGSLQISNTSIATGVDFAHVVGSQNVFVNNGTLSVLGVLATVVGGVGSVQNNGTLTVTGGVATGVSQSIVNAGTLTVQGASATGILDSATGTLDQNLVGATLTVSGQGNSIGAWIAQGGEFDNAGSLNVSGGVNPGTTAYGVLMTGSPNVGHGVTYSVVDNSGSIVVTGGTTVGVAMNSALFGALQTIPSGQYNLTNSGTITAQTAVLFGYGVASAAFHNTGTVNGDVTLSSGDDRLLNTGVINGTVNLLGGHDTLDSSGGAIHGLIVVGQGASTLTLGAEDNVVSLMSGDEVVDAGGGQNTLLYAGAGFGVSVSLALQGQAQAVGMGSDTLSHFQNLGGSLFDDTLEGDGGDNVLDGGSGTNTVSYAHAASGVTVSLALQGAAQDTLGAGHDSLSNFQNLTGSAFDDILEGNGGGNVLDGGAGTNTVSYARAASGVTVSLASQGQAQNTVGAGTDTLSNFRAVVGSAYADTLEGGGSDSSLTGGQGADCFVYRPGDGQVTVTDFSHAQGDKIDLTGYPALHVLEDVLSNAVQSGANTIINLPGGGSLILDNLDKTSLSEADFVFTYKPHADFDGDGRGDLFWQNAVNNLTSVWSVDTGGATHGVSLPAVPGWQTLDTGNFSGGPYGGDFLLRNTATGMVNIWQDNAGTMSGQDVAQATLDWQIMGTADFNGDGKSDILWRNEQNGYVSVWQMDGAKVATTYNPGVVGLEWKIVSAGDYLGDGKAEVLWRNVGTGEVNLWTIDGPGAGQTHGETIGYRTPDWKIVGSADFNGDGRSDILWQNQVSGQMNIWELDGPQVLASQDIGNPGPQWRVVGVSDINGDGKGDILWRDSGTGQVVTWQMNGFTVDHFAVLATVANTWQTVNHHYDWA